MNTVALIGQVASEVESRDGDQIRFSLAVLGRHDTTAAIVIVQAGGAQSGPCRRYLRVGARVAIEGRVVPGADPADVVADRIQFLTSGARRDGDRPDRA